ncbi:hypothetical protein XENORESO_018782, partial [Xenotaenia resolanae]
MCYRSAVRQCAAELICLTGAEERFVRATKPYQRNITAEPGQNIILPCRAADNKPVIAVEWRRTDLGKEYVLLYRDGRIDPGNQHQSYKNRVDLQDRQMMEGNVSLVLRNLTINDTGEYECEVQNEGSLETKLLRTIQLDVPPP